jgi:ubiquinone/menaquinone biosynthesis C-methylase UbiE
MNYEAIKRYWNERAAESRGLPNATTNDYYMRVIESRELIERIRGLRSNVATIADIGCGDGLTTISVARAFPEIKFVGRDYSRNMIESASQHLQKDGLANVTFVENDVINDPDDTKFDLVFTTRCLINLPSEEMQRTALQRIRSMLVEGGVYLMIENFIDGQVEFNRLRADFGLPEIKVREHNRFFDEQWFIPFIEDKFEVVEKANISSLYYLVSRVIYSKICAIRGSTPDYFDIHHELASQLPSCGNFGPVKMLVLRKK